MNKMNKFWIITIFVAMAAVSCKTTNRIVFTNLAGLYNPETKLKITGVRIYHLNDSISKVFLRYRTSGLEYRMVPGIARFEAEYKFSYQLFSSFDSGEILDSGTFVFTDTLREDQSDKFFDFPLKAKAPATYLLEISYTDLIADDEMLYSKIVQKENLTTRQNFLPLNEAGEVIFEDFIDWKTRFWITSNRSGLSGLTVDFYNKDFPPALPPFSGKHAEAYQLEPDSVFNIDLFDGISDIFQYANEGIYHFRPDKSNKNGFTFFRFEDYFPELKRPEQLIPPLRYLCSNNEFEQLINSKDAKVAVDEFWLSVGGNEERAIELIQKYYGRVEAANRLFSAYKEGWKTDRGMIYIIFGEPVTVYRRDDVETWIYGRQGERVFLTFDFIRAINPFTANDFELQRKPEYKQQWYNAVWFWRR
jgi:GWxTD domain-containing protein